MNPKARDDLLARYRIDSGKHFRLKDHDPADTGGDLVNKQQGEHLLREGVERLSDLQRQLYANNRSALLVSFQAMDAGGKDGTIRHVMSGVNPQGVQVTSFKQPGPEELARDFLWRVHHVVPQRGRIGIFNRSHYEEVLVVRVHPELLARQRLPGRTSGAKFWRHRLADITAFETYLAHQGIAQVKFFLHLSKAEQKQRFLDRLDEPDKHWKFSSADLAERAHWDAYQAAYEEAIVATASKHAPWFVVPADAKWFAHLVVVEVMIDVLEKMDLTRPTLSEEDTARLAEARRALQAE